MVTIWVSGYASCCAAGQSRNMSTCHVSGTVARRVLDVLAGWRTGFAGWEFFCLLTSIMIDACRLAIYRNHVEISDCLFLLHCGFVNGGVLIAPLFQLPSWKLTIGSSTMCYQKHQQCGIKQDQPDVTPCLYIFLFAQAESLQPQEICNICNLVEPFVLLPNISFWDVLCSGKLQEWNVSRITRNDSIQEGWISRMKRPNN